MANIGFLFFPHWAENKIYDSNKGIEKVIGYRLYSLPHILPLPQTTCSSRFFDPLLRLRRSQLSRGSVALMPVLSVSDIFSRPYKLFCGGFLSFLAIFVPDFFFFKNLRSSTIKSFCFQSQRICAFRYCQTVSLRTKTLALFLLTWRWTFLPNRKIIVLSGQ